MFLRIDVNELDQFFSDACDQYENTSVFVYDYLQALYVRLDKEPDSILLTELTTVLKLSEENCWLPASYAQNLIYRMLERTGKDTTGALDH